jgi:DNA polymerase I
MNNLIIDGGNHLHRTFHAAKGKGYINGEDKDFSHIVLFLKNIKHFKDMFNPDRIFVSWDIRDKDFINFRQDSNEYKTQRDRTEHEDVHHFDSILWHLNEKLGITNIKANKLEGDDIIYFLVNKYSDCKNVVVSNDGDFLQLFNMFDDVTIYNPNKQVTITKSNSSQYNGGVDNDKFLLYKAVMGDKSDNIKGLHNYGPVKSKKFVENFKENFNSLSYEDKSIIKNNLRVMNLRVGFEMYPDEIDFLENQDKHYKADISGFFNILDKLGISKYMGYKSDWFDFNNEDQVDNLKKLVNLINN